MENPILTVQDLTVQIKNQQDITILNNINFDLQKGETLCIVGESGCGKSFTALSIMGLLPKKAKAYGKIMFKGKNLLQLSNEELRDIRGKEISMVFQDPLTSLNPLFSIYEQLSEIFIAHGFKNKKELKTRCLKILEDVKIPDPKTKLFSYPHELSGGQRQRILIGMAVALEPDIIIADEPTTALDVTIQYEILSLFNRLKRKKGLSALYITHDLSVVSEVGDRVIIMYAGTILEQGPKESILNNPYHPYTKGLLNSIPSLEKRGSYLTPIPGFVPSAENRPKGCPFHPRCLKKQAICTKKVPDKTFVSDNHFVYCHLVK